MTLQDLKDNREEIINFIDQKSYDLKFAMEIAADLARNCDTVSELLIELEQYCTPVKRVSRNAEIMGKLTEMEIERGTSYFAK